MFRRAEMDFRDLPQGSAPLLISRPVLNAHILKTEQWTFTSGGEFPQGGQSCRKRWLRLWKASDLTIFNAKNLNFANFAVFWFWYILVILFLHVAFLIMFLLFFPNSRSNFMLCFYKIPEFFMTFSWHFHPFLLCKGSGSLTAAGEWLANGVPCRDLQPRPDDSHFSFCQDRILQHDNKAARTCISCASAVHQPCISSRCRCGFCILVEWHSWRLAISFANIVFWGLKSCQFLKNMFSVMLLSFVTSTAYLIGQDRRLGCHHHHRHHQLNHQLNHQLQKLKSHPQDPS